MKESFFKMAEPNLGDVIQIPGTGNFVWVYKNPEDSCSGFWRKMSKREWDAYASRN